MIVLDNIFINEVATVTFYICESDQVATHCTCTLTPLTPPPPTLLYNLDVLRTSTLILWVKWVQLLHGLLLTFNTGEWLSKATKVFVVCVCFCFGPWQWALKHNLQLFILSTDKLTSRNMLVMQFTHATVHEHKTKYCAQWWTFPTYM